MYLIFTDENDVHYHYIKPYKGHKEPVNYICKTGVNIFDNNIFNIIITLPIHMCMYHGQYCYVRVVNIITNDIHQPGGTTKVILSDRYYLFDSKTIRKFNIKVDQVIIGWACKNGAVNFLDWWLKSGLPLEYDFLVLSFASKYRHVNVLEWWLKSGLLLSLDNHPVFALLQWNMATMNGSSLYDACCDGYVDVLEWWFNSNLPLEYSISELLSVALQNGHVNVLTWFINNNFEVSLQYRMIVYYNRIKNNIKYYIGL